MATNERCRAGRVPVSIGLAAASVPEDNPFAMRGVESFDILPLDGGGIRGVHASHLLAGLKDAIGAPVRGVLQPACGNRHGVDYDSRASWPAEMDRLPASALRARPKVP